MDKNEEEKEILKEINNWLRHLERNVWVIISLFISLNVYLAKTKLQLRIHDVHWFTKWIIIGLCALHFYYTISQIVISLKLVDLLRDKQLTIKELYQAVRTSFTDFKTIRFLRALITPFGIIVCVITFVLVIFWLGLLTITI